MLLFSRKTGYNGSKGMIQYATSWDKHAMCRDAEIFFYAKNPENIIDIHQGQSEKDVEVLTYTHNRDDIMSFCTKKEAALIDLFNLAKQKFPDRKIFTVDADSMKIIDDEDFTCYRPSKIFKYNYFTFQGKGTANTFPTTFMIASQTGSGQYKWVFGAQVFTSHYCLKAAGAHTKFGKSFTYILATSVERRKFTGDVVPTIMSIDFPTNGRETLPAFYRTESFRAFMEKCQADNLKVVDGEVLLLSGPTPLEVAEADTLDNLAYVLSKDESDSSEVALRIQKQVLDKNSVSVTDLMQHGVINTFKDIPVQSGIIPVDLDVGGIARKMCLYQGKVYVIPVMEKTEWQFYFGADPDFFVECNEETYPTGSI